MSNGYVTMGEKARAQAIDSYRPEKYVTDTEDFEIPLIGEANA